MTDAAKSETSQQYDLRILRALRRITRSIALHSRQLSAVSHITAPQLMCLRTVIANGPMTATAISREMHVSPSTVVGILDRLEDKALIRRERDPVVARIIEGWPQRFDTRRAEALGFKAETSFEDIIRILIEDELGGQLPGA